jgi:short subunit dehydrogenase
MRLNGKVAWVVGGSSGIGAAVARELASRGGTVAISARRDEQLRQVSGGHMLVVPLDVTDAASVVAAATRVREELGPVDLAVSSPTCRTRTPPRTRSAHTAASCSSSAPTTTARSASLPPRRCGPTWLTSPASPRPAASTSGLRSLCRWARRHDLLAANPIDRIDTIKVPRSLPRPAAAADVAKVLAVICTRPRKDIELDRLRDRVLFETAYVCGLHVEDLNLRLDDEHGRIHGKDGTVRTVLLDDRGYVALLKLYQARAGYTAEPLFRASINGRGGPPS